jgi:biopolymer transport protein ExbB/TolQ
MKQKSTSRRGPISLMTLGVLMLLGPVWGLLGTVVGMVRAFGELSQSGAADAGTLASSIDLSLWTTVIGLAIFPVGLILLIVGIIWLVKVNRRNQEPSNKANSLDPPSSGQ